jgi:hypothetical protein
MTRYCYVCKKEIEPERANGLPDTELCVEHSEEIKQYGGEFLPRGHRPSARPKPGSIKPGNVGDVDIDDKHRNREAMDRLRDEYRLNR